MTEKTKPLPNLVFKKPRAGAIKILENKETLFETVMDSIGDLVSIQDRDLRIIYQNQAIKKLMGDRYGMHCYKVYERRERACTDCPLKESFKTGDIAKALRIGISQKGVAGKYELITAPIKNKKSQIVAGVEMVRDVTERERTIEELKEKTTDLENFKKLAIGRELKMIELKKELAKLKGRGNSIRNLNKTKL